MESMMTFRGLAASFIAVVTLGTAVPLTVIAQSEQTTWDDLQLVRSSQSQRVYLLPGADFRPFTKVMLDPTEVAFRRNWARDFNRTVGTVSRRITDADIERITREVSTNFGDIFAEEYQRAGFQVVQSPGPDVLRVRTGVIDLSISAPDIRSSSRVRSAAWEAGAATLVVEARDSQTGALLGRALDRRWAGDNQRFLRNSVTNRADFRILFRSWARDSIDGLRQLQSTTPIAVARK
jgi:hypothetical protein